MADISSEWGAANTRERGARRECRVVVAIGEPSGVEREGLRAIFNLRVLRLNSARERAEGDSPGTPGTDTCAWRSALGSRLRVVDCSPTFTPQNTLARAIEDWKVVVGVKTEGDVRCSTAATAASMR